MSVACDGTSTSANPGDPEGFLNIHVWLDCPLFVIICIMRITKARPEFRRRLMTKKMFADVREVRIGWTIQSSRGTMMDYTSVDSRSIPTGEREPLKKDGTKASSRLTLSGGVDICNTLNGARSKRCSDGHKIQRRAEKGSPCTALFLFLNTYTTFQTRTSKQ